MSDTKFLDLLGLQRYDAKIKNWVGTQIPTTPHLYKHNLKMVISSAGIEANFVIYNSSNVQMTKTDFFDMLDNYNYLSGVASGEEYNDLIPNYLCTAGYNYDTDDEVVHSLICIFDIRNSSYTNCYRETPNTTLYDTITQLF